MTSWTGLGQRFVEEMACSVNCFTLGRGKKHLNGGQQKHPAGYRQQNFPAKKFPLPASEHYDFMNEDKCEPRPRMFSWGTEFECATESTTGADTASLANEGASDGQDWDYDVRGDIAETSEHSPRSIESDAAYPADASKTQSPVAEKEASQKVPPRMTSSPSPFGAAQARSPSPVGYRWPSPAGSRSHGPVRCHRPSHIRCRSSSPVNYSSHRASIAGAVAPAMEVEKQKPQIDESLATGVLLKNPSALQVMQSEMDWLSTGSASEDGEQQCTEDWSGQADIPSTPGLEECAPVSRLMQARVVRHVYSLSSSIRPWHAGESTELYAEMGMRSCNSSYVVCWLNLNNVSLLFVSEVVDKALLQLCQSEDALKQRLKLIVKPVKCSYPFPARPPATADTIGAFFDGGYFSSSSNCSLVHRSSNEGSEYLTLQVDLYSKFLLRQALQKVGFVEGNIFDILVVDWPGQAVLCSLRLNVTEEYLGLIA